MLVWVQTVKIKNKKRMYCELAVLMAKHNPPLSQVQLATTLGLSRPTVHKLYNGRPLTARIDPSTVEKICGYFGCGIDDLFVLQKQEPAK